MDLVEILVIVGAVVRRWGKGTTVTATALPTMGEFHRRLEVDSGLSRRAVELLLGTVARSDDGPDVEAASQEGGSGGEQAFLSSIRVTGFRGIGPEAELDLPPGPGLTLIAGRNGAGKSSFADALEYLLTGDSYRWRGKGSKIWRTGWANVHHQGERSIRVVLQLEGSALPLQIEHRWGPGDDLDDGAGQVLLGERPVTLQWLGWEAALDTYRPFLPYDELELMLAEGPSHLYDALAAVLGLDDLTAVSASLAGERKALQVLERETKSVLSSDILPALEGLDDERADRCHKALKGRKWDLDDVATVLSGAVESDDTSSELARARQLLHLAVPSPDRVTSTVAEWREALAAQRGWQGTDADRARRTAQLLEKAMEFHDHFSDSACPVCGEGRLDSDWHAGAAAEVEDLRTAASTADAASRRLQEARSSLTELLRIPDVLDGGAAHFPVDVGPLVAAWESFNSMDGLADDSVADHVDETYPAVADQAEALRSRAELWISAHDDRWRPIAEEISAWLPAARRVVASRGDVAALKEAEKWVADLSDEMRVERFRPIEERARELWTMMRCASNVSLDGLSLAGKATRRRLELDVSVDGESAASVAVMSQGELNTLALSLFLPRATLPESPFGFVVIDDPVQSMDPSRVDGLAKALDLVARDRQVVVFTHDDRLPDAVRRLGIAADVVQVQRRPNSAVEVTQVQDPVRRYLGDANFLARTRLPPHVQGTVVPLLLRQAIEAAAQRSVRARRLLQGDSVSQIDEDLEDCETIQVVGFALLDRKCSADEVYAGIEDRFGQDAARAVRTCNAGAHQGVAGGLEELAKTAGQFARKLEKG